MATLKDLWALALLKLFIWSGSKLFPVIAIYNPGGDDDGNLKAVHFAANEYHLKQSASKLAEA